MFGHTLKSKYSSCQDGFVEMSSNHINTGIILVADDIVDENYLYQNHIIGNYNTLNKDKIKDIENNINNLVKDDLTNNYILPSGTTKLSIREATVGLSAMATFITFIYHNDDHIYCHNLWWIFLNYLFM